MTSHNKRLLISIAISLLMVSLAFWSVSDRFDETLNPFKESSISFVGDKQVIDIFVKGGYSPRSITAKAGVPTVLRMKTDDTFDCSASLMIPILSYRKFLPSSGIEEIRISSDQAQGEIRGFCSMGMYGFRINFR